MLRVSVVSLIFQSTKLADWVYGSVQKYTPMIARGEAEFFFVANDPTPSLLAHLKDRNYPHMVNINRLYSDEELLAHGYGAPEYMSRVYRGYNEGIRQAHGDYVVLINSDNYFSPDWLENLLKYSDRSRVITSTLVERHHPVFSVFPGAMHGEFGASPDTFDEEGFLSYAARIRKTGLEAGGAYMPTLFHRDIAVEAGLYPCGNVAGDGFADIARYGDEAFFDVLRSLGVAHYTALDSISYHLKEGERDDRAGEQSGSASSPQGVVPSASTPIEPYPTTQALKRVLDSMSPSQRHTELMNLISSDQAQQAREWEAEALAAEEAVRVAELAARVAEEAARVAEQNSAQLAEQTTGIRLDDQAQRLRRAVERVFGARFADPVMRVIHSASWMIRPLRVRLARRQRTR
jgi:hypothetical protein